MKISVYSRSTRQRLLTRACLMRSLRCSIGSICYSVLRSHDQNALHVGHWYKLFDGIPSHSFWQSKQYSLRSCSFGLLSSAPMFSVIDSMASSTGGLSMNCGARSDLSSVRMIVSILSFIWLFPGDELVSDEDWPVVLEDTPWVLLGVELGGVVNHVLL